MGVMAVAAIAKLIRHLSYPNYPPPPHLLILNYTNLTNQLNFNKTKNDWRGSLRARGVGFKGISGPGCLMFGTAQEPGDKTVKGLPGRSTWLQQTLQVFV